MKPEYFQTYLQEISYVTSPKLHPKLLLLLLNVTYTYCHISTHSSGIVFFVPRTLNLSVLFLLNMQSY